MNETKLKVNRCDEGICPKCGSGNVEYQDDERQDECVVFYNLCNDCKTEYREVYTLSYLHSTFEEITEDKPAPSDES